MKQINIPEILAVVTGMEVDDLQGMLLKVMTKQIDEKVITTQMLCAICFNLVAEIETLQSRVEELETKQHC